MSRIESYNSRAPLKVSIKIILCSTLLLFIFSHVVLAQKPELVLGSGHTESVRSLAFTPDGRILASGSADKTVKLWDVATGAELRTLGGSTQEVTSVAFSPDGKVLATGFGGDVSFNISREGAVSIRGGKGKVITLWDVSSGARLRTLVEDTGSVTSLAFSPDGKTLASGSYLTETQGKLAPIGSPSSHAITLWDVTTGTKLHSFVRTGFASPSVTFSSDGKTLLAGGHDTSITFFDTTNKRESATFVSVDKKDWVVVAPDGLFDGSPGAWGRLIWRNGNVTSDFAPVEAFFSDFYYPGLLNDILAGKQPRAKTNLALLDRRQPEVKLRLIDQTSSPALVVSNRFVKVNISVAELPRDEKHPSGTGASDVRLFRNGSLVKVWRGDVLQGKSSATLEIQVPIISGENRLTAYAFNRDNVKSRDATLTITGADSLKRKGIAYVLVVGVNEYANAQYNLQYAVPDAQAFGEEVKRQQSNLDKYERVEVIALNDKDATKANILKSLGDLSAKVQPEDAVIIYFAGHGTAHGNRFYLIPHDLGYSGGRTQLDAAGLQSILSHSISDEELEREVEGIDASHLLLVVDACNSGQALESEEKRRGPMNSKGLAQLGYEKGMYILTASQSYQAALETSKLGHGYLTYALVEDGLKSRLADNEPRDGQVLLREWLDYATQRVPQMQDEDYGKRQLVQQETQTSPPRDVQRPRVFYRREVESQPLVVAKPRRG